MFGYVSISAKELTKEQLQRYNSIYCGICRSIRDQASQPARLTLSYDMAFLALLLMSLYEPEETIGPNACILHPIKKRPWVDNAYVRYAADMNVALAFHNCMDDWKDDRSSSAKLMADVLKKSYPSIAKRYSRQCEAIETCIAELNRLEKDNCVNPDQPANCFGRLMAELLVYEEDMWTSSLREMGMALGRFIYLADAAIDYRKDEHKGKYNPYLAMGTGQDWRLWEEHLVLAMSRCTDYYERLPLVQDKAVLDNILYSGVWTNFGRLRKKAGEQN